MIQKAQVIRLILAKCPWFTSTWEEYRTLWRREEAGIYNDLGEFATFVVNCYAQQDTEPVAAAFGVVEELLVGGEEEVRTAAASGFLEDVRNIASWRPFGSDVFIQWLGPQSKLAWAEIEQTRRGETNLADVVRAEQTAAKNKPKS